MTNRISIHAPREGCDSSSPASKTVSHADFNPRTPRGVRHWESSRDAPACDFNPRTPRGVRRIFTAIRPSGRSFQSTHPARGATRDIRTLTKESFYISIHAPREGCDTMARAIDGELLISIHAPREGCDVQPYLRPYCIPISIHAPREGCDEHLTEADFVLEAFQSTHPARGATLLRPAKGGQPGHFNPRTPRGVRR